MFIEIERYTNFIVSNNITQSQFYFLYLLHFERYDLMDKYRKAFPSEDGTVIGKTLRNDLIERGFIVQVDTSEVATSYKVGDKFKDLFVDKIVAGNEFWDLYPSYMMSEGKRYPLNLMDKYDFYALYGQRIGYSRQEHEEVMKDLHYALNHNLISGRIETFVRSEQWNSIRKLRSNISNVTIEVEGHVE